jgi:hypothetical protein
MINEGLIISVLLLGCVALWLLIALLIVDHEEVRKSDDRS